MRGDESDSVDDDDDAQLQQAPSQTGAAIVKKKKKTSPVHMGFSLLYQGTTNKRHQ
jgi:hypothetical protein